MIARRDAAVKAKEDTMQPRLLPLHVAQQSQHFPMTEQQKQTDFQERFGREATAWEQTVAGRWD